MTTLEQSLPKTIKHICLFLKFLHKELETPKSTTMEELIDSFVIADSKHIVPYKNVIGGAVVKAGILTRTGSKNTPTYHWVNKAIEPNRVMSKKIRLSCQANKHMPKIVKGVLLDTTSNAITSLNNKREKDICTNTLVMKALDTKYAEINAKILALTEEKRILGETYRIFGIGYRGPVK